MQVHGATEPRLLWPPGYFAILRCRLHEYNSFGHLHSLPHFKDHWRSQVFCSLLEAQSSSASTRAAQCICGIPSGSTTRRHGWRSQVSQPISYEGQSSWQATAWHLLGGTFFRDQRRKFFWLIDISNDDAMLLHLITSDDIYRKQEDTFISWSDPEAGLRLSLSFQDAEGCSRIWDMICKVQRHIRAGILDDTDAPRVMDPLEPPKWFLLQASWGIILYEVKQSSSGHLKELKSITA